MWKRFTGQQYKEI